MKIKKMTATFGKLDGATLSPGPGLTVITAPNEGGKSTWCAFLKAMFYGLDTRERDRAGGALAEKNRYLPWSGAPMSGQLELEWQGRDITLRRRSTKASPMQKFEAVYTASGDPVPDLTGANAGQTLLRVGREVFLRSAFLGQGAGAVTAAPELEQRIAALATAGQEDVSFSATQRLLKDWRNRRQSNRTTGLIPQLQKQLEQVQGELKAMERARDLRAQALTQLERLEQVQTQLQGELELQRRLEQQQRNRQYAQAQEELAQAEQRLAQLPAPDPEFAGLTPQQARARAAAQSPAPSAPQGESQALQALSRRRKTLWTAFLTASPLTLLLGLAGVVAGFLTRYPLLLTAGFLLMAGAVALAVVLLSRVEAADRALSRLRREPEPDAPPSPTLLERAEEYVDWLARREELEKGVDHHRQMVEYLKAQGAREEGTLEFLAPPRHSRAQLEEQLEQLGKERSRWQTQLDKATGALGCDPLTLEARRDGLQRQIEEREEQLAALDQALEGLEAANAQLRERFAPALNQKAGQLFSQLTGGAHQGLTLRRDFSALVEDGAGELRAAGYLSAGATDQLYLAVRLALSQLTLPDCPLILDDALANFDDARAALALDCLASLAQQRQILLFSCHRREADWARQRGVPVLTI